MGRVFSLVFAYLPQIKGLWILSKIIDGRERVPTEEDPRKNDEKINRNIKTLVSCFRRSSVTNRNSP